MQKPSLPTLLLALCTSGCALFGGPADPPSGQLAFWPVEVPPEDFVQQLYGESVIFVAPPGSEDEVRSWAREHGVPVEQILATHLPPIPPESPPARPVRTIAEWEPARGVLLHWPLILPDELLVEFAARDPLYVLVTPAEEVEMRTHMDELGIAPALVRPIHSEADTGYPRDYGPHQLIDGEGRYALLDPVFCGWPVYAQGLGGGPGGRPVAHYLPLPGDDAVAIDVARHLGTPLYRMPAFLTGGNFLVDGAGGAFCTVTQVDENRQLMDEERFGELLETYCGIERLCVLENTEPYGIQHIDCWLKVLDGERLLVKRPPAGHPEEAAIERNLERIAEFPTASGGTWEILRIDCPEFELEEDWVEHELPIAAYTNSLILNDRVFVPLYGIEGDEAALATWREALPDHEVHGFVFDGWRHFDALHCRTRALFDPAAPRAR